MCDRPIDRLENATACLRAVRDLVATPRDIDPSPDDFYSLLDSIIRELSRVRADL
ncbi:hypothetical protein [Paracoccus sp. (in: a-proteobacteria)]|uniref:hypothetical protein n=1 Tax=Paracoccus sp. TaxID=267 RepID=UPI0026E042BA|nr:hypothetical protein [Paracoccus sp. (in: a-proteobacteria)]MDO5648374.1 hypothetical protein [Paracoccus sp. (in: a-proteobacteria)]